MLRDQHRACCVVGGPLREPFESRLLPVFAPSTVSAHRWPAAMALRAIMPSFLIAWPGDGATERVEAEDAIRSWHSHHTLRSRIHGVINDQDGILVPKVIDNVVAHVVQGLVSVPLDPVQQPMDTVRARVVGCADECPAVLPLQRSERSAHQSRENPSQ